MRKKLTILAVMLALVLGGYYGLKSLSPKTQKGEKVIYITLIDEIEGVVLIDKQAYNTNVETLGHFFDEDHPGIVVVLKDFGFGRSIEEFNGLVGDMSSANGPWIFYESENNQACLAAGYCSGIDDLPIYDGDHFVFKYSDASLFD